MSSSPNMDDDTWNERSATEKQQIAEAVQMIKHFKQLEVNSIDSNRMSSHTNPIRESTTRSESLAEEELIEQLKTIINEFMTRPSRPNSFNTTMRWTIDYGNHINYSVVILINQPSELI